ncbi:MAG TPA: DUF1996 domain-containing protein [Polyangiales bacterium]|nr:DUF1996 domain-containing protein [Polyangiales bacterium]
MVQQAVSRFTVLAVLITISTLGAFGCSQDGLDPNEVDNSELNLAGKHHDHAAAGSSAVDHSSHVGHEAAGGGATGAAGSGETQPVVEHAVHTEHNVVSGTDTNAAGSDAMDPATHADHMAAAASGGDANANAAPSGAADPAMEHSMHTATTASGAPAMGPSIDLNTLPSGDPGSSTVDIGTTSEAPAGSDGVRAFRTECDLSHMAKDDPIVFPGKPGAAHLHSFFGNSLTDANSTQDSIRNTGNSTCRGGIANRSSYWVPALVDAQGKVVEPLKIDVYYKSGYNGIAAKDIQQFPSGLRVIAGSAKSSSAQEHAYWDCHGDYIGHPGSIPQCSSKADALNMVVEFPQCWDGVNLDSADHTTHMAYTSNGKCPSTHPVAIPVISFNVLYPVRDVKGWHLASDMYDQSMPGGFSAHGDWFEGWDPEVSKAFIQNCVNKAVDCHSHLLGDGRDIF